MAEATVRTAAPLDKARILQWLQTYGVYAGVALLLIVNIVITPHFLSAENFRTQAVQDGDEWVINGHKWFISNARRASFAILIARTIGFRVSPEDEARGVDLSEHSESAYAFGEDVASYDPLAEEARA